MTWCLVLWVAWAWPERGPENRLTGRDVRPGEVLVEAPLPVASEVVPRTHDLGAVASATASFLRLHPSDAAAHAGLFAELGITLDDVISTLEFVAEVANQDQRTGDDRLADPAFLAAHFTYLRWRPDRPAPGADPNRIRLTRYLVYESQGSPVPNERFDTALYAAPVDPDTGEGPLAVDEGPDAIPPALYEPIRLRYTRRQVYAGVYEMGGEAAGLAKPLVWLTRDDVNRALMQGTVRVVMQDGQQHFFNVDVSNGIPYYRAVADPNQQDRYWYFREVESIRGYGPSTSRIPVRAGVTVAGDVYNLGLGKLVLLDHKGTARLLVLADTGGAFQPNLHQLDWLTGIYPTHRAFVDETSWIPDHIGAGFLLLKEQAPAP